MGKVLVNLDKKNVCKVCGMALDSTGKCLECGFCQKDTAKFCDGCNKCTSEQKKVYQSVFKNRSPEELGEM